MKKEVLIFLNGRYLSGAEKRIIKTAKRLGYEGVVRLVISKELYKCYEESDIFSTAPNGLHFIQLKGVKNKHLYRVNQILDCIQKAFYVFKYKSPVYSVLFSKLDVILLRILAPLAKKVTFEITSPDIARSSKVNLINRLATNRFFIIFVTPNVERISKESIDFSSELQLITRSVPFVDESLKSRIVNYKNKEKKIIYAHRLVERKHPIIALEAFLTLAINNPNWEFVVFGTGPMELELKSKLPSIVPGNFKFGGYCNDMEQSLSESSMFVSLIKPDAYPSQSIVEAMLLGNAVVVGNTIYAPKKFLDQTSTNSNGYIVDFKCESLQSAVQSFIDEPEENRLRMMRNSVKLVNDRFSQDVYDDESETVF